MRTDDPDPLLRLWNGGALDSQQALAPRKVGLIGLNFLEEALQCNVRKLGDKRRTCPLHPILLLKGILFVLRHALGGRPWREGTLSLDAKL